MLPVDMSRKKRLPDQSVLYHPQGQARTTVKPTAAPAQVNIPPVLTFNPRPQTPQPAAQHALAAPQSDTEPPLPPAQPTCPKRPKFHDVNSKAWFEGIRAQFHYYGPKFTSPNTPILNLTTLEYNLECLIKEIDHYKGRIDPTVASADVNQLRFDMRKIIAVMAQRVWGWGKRVGELMPGAEGGDPAGNGEFDGLSEEAAAMLAQAKPAVKEEAVANPKTPPRGKPYRRPIARMSTAVMTTPVRSRRPWSQGVDGDENEDEL